MTKPDLDILKTERAQVIFILLFIAAALFCTIRYVFIPQRAIAEANRTVRRQLAGSKFSGYSINSMLTVAEHENQNLKQLSNEWARIAARLTSFEDQSILRNIGVDRIDYKVQLYDLRKRLESKSLELSIPLVPKELGLDEDLGSGEAVRVRMLQLKAVEKLADLTLDRQISRLVEIYPLAPVVHKNKDGQRIFTEYPVRVECDIDFEHLYTFFQSVFEKNQVFAFRNIRVESGPTFDSKLRVKAVLSALLFD